MQNNMAGFGQSIRDWAGLGGDEQAEEAPPPSPADQPMSPDEIRQKRLARMAASTSSSESVSKKPNGGGRIDFSSPGLNLADSSMELDDNEGGVTPMEGVEEETAETTCPPRNSGVSFAPPRRVTSAPVFLPSNSLDARPLSSPRWRRRCPISLLLSPFRFLPLLQH